MHIVAYGADALPPLHAPYDRQLLAHVGAWEIRRHASDESRFAYFAARAMLHLQLWHPVRRVSVLTPSRLTRGRFEIACGARRAWVATWPGVVAQLPELELPSGAELAALTMWLVVRNEIEARTQVPLGGQATAAPLDHGVAHGAARRRDEGQQ